MSDGCLLLTESALVRGLSKKQFEVLVDVSLMLNQIRNLIVDLTYLVKSDDGKHYRKLNYKPLITRVKNEFNEQYSYIQAHIANAAIKKHVESFNAFVELNNMQIDDKYKDKVNPPDKHDNNCLHNIIIFKESITSSKKKLSEGYIELPLSRTYKSKLESKDCRP